MKRRTLILVAITAAALATSTVTAQAPAPSASVVSPAAVGDSIEVLVVHATRGEKPREGPQIDPRIGDLPELSQAPFSLYDKFDLLQRERLPLKRGEPRSLTLPNGQDLVTELLEVLSPETFRVAARITKPGGKAFLAKLEVKAWRGKPFIVAGQSYKSGILVLVLRVVR